MHLPADYLWWQTIARNRVRTEVPRVSNRSGVESRSRAELAVPMDVMGDGKIEFAELLRHHQTQLFGYIYSLVRDLDDADDLFQQTSLVLWDKFAAVRSREELHQLGMRRGPL